MASLTDLDVDVTPDEMGAAVADVLAKMSGPRPETPLQQALGAERMIAFSLCRYGSIWHEYVVAWRAALAVDFGGTTTLQVIR